MKIAIIGYGRIGREIEKAALERGHSIIARIDNELEWEQHKKLFCKADVAIEFSLAGSAPANILRCFEFNLPVVSGTTGWLDRMDEINRACLENKQAFFYAPNFSIGVNIFFELNKKLAQMMSDFGEYEISISEAHHIHKADAPSGTAIKLADDIISESGQKKAWTDSPDPGEDEIGITSLREGSIPGTHTVVYESSFDKIEITHSAKSRKGFAIGAVMAAEWLPGKKGVFGINHLLKTSGNQ
ncbi:MAG TPA: 4-hydroxy-tetrahydrodipicolinate reductase [Bacteroidales bacterium]|nr:4-hydroxy-tetrahydrodipicolinate reductase [Bacteroidales bacterium]